MPLQLKSSFPYVVTIDEQPVHLAIKRLTIDEFEAFNARFGAFTDGRGEPLKGDARPTSAEWLAQVDDEAAYRAKNAAWIRDTFEQFVTVQSGDLTVDTEVILGGGRFVDLFGGYQRLVGEVLGQIWVENSLTADQKKILQSRRDSATGSPDARPPAPDGDRPAAVAPNAAREASAEPVAAMALSSDGSSGTTVLSCSEPVLSGS